MSLRPRRSPRAPPSTLNTQSARPEPRRRIVLSQVEGPTDGRAKHPPRLVVSPPNHPQPSSPLVLSQVEGPTDGRTHHPPRVGGEPVEPPPLAVTTTPPSVTPSVARGLNSLPNPILNPAYTQSVRGEPVKPPPRAASPSQPFTLLILRPIAGSPKPTLTPTPLVLILSKDRGKPT